MVSQDFINFIPDYPHIEFTQECKVGRHAASSPAVYLQVWLQGRIIQGVVFDLQMKNAVILGFCWTSWNEIVFVTDQGIEFYQVP